MDSTSSSAATSAATSSRPSFDAIRPVAQRQESSNNIFRSVAKSLVAIAHKQEQSTTEAQRHAPIPYSMSGWQPHEAAEKAAKKQAKKPKRTPVPWSRVNAYY